MKDAAALLTSIAALIAALAWPAALFAIFVLYRSQLRMAIERLPAAIDRMQKVKLGILEAELSKTASAVIDNPDKSGQISAQEIQSAALI